jgi:hypothetical protein
MEALTEEVYFYDTQKEASEAADRIEELDERVAIMSVEREAERR